MAIRERFINLLKELVIDSRKSLNDDSRFIDDLGLDSLDGMELLMECEEEFDIDIHDSNMENLKTIGQTVEFITDSIKNKGKPKDSKKVSKEDKPFITFLSNYTMIEKYQQISIGQKVIDYCARNYKVSAKPVHEVPNKINDMMNFSETLSIMSQCNMLVLLPNWEKRSCCRILQNIATEYGMKILYINEY